MHIWKGMLQLSPASLVKIRPISAAYASKQVYNFVIVVINVGKNIEYRIFYDLSSKLI